MTARCSTNWATGARYQLSPSTPPRLQNHSLIGIKNELDKSAALSLCGLASAQSQMDLCIDTRETNKGLPILTKQSFCNIIFILKVLLWQKNKINSSFPLDFKTKKLVAQVLTFDLKKTPICFYWNFFTKWSAIAWLILRRKCTPKIQ